MDLLDFLKKGAAANEAEFVTSWSFQKKSTRWRFGLVFPLNRLGTVM